VPKTRALKAQALSPKHIQKQGEGVTYTNKFNLPNEVVHWLKTDDYDYNKNPQVISATTLMKPIQAIELELRFKNHITVDVADLVTSRYGSAIHDSFEKASPPNTIQEVRYHRVLEDFTISGKVDMIRNIDNEYHRITDLKSTSVWTFVKESRKQDYITQMSIYRWLVSNGWYEENNEKKTVQMKIEDTADIFYVFTDWSKADARAKPNSYPQSRVATATVKLMSNEETEKWIKQRLELIREARNQSVPRLPKCSKEELWQSDTTYAVKKRDAKRAARVFDNVGKAIAMSKTSPDYIIETREGEVRRCDYCLGKPFCTQAEQLIQQGLLK